MSRHSSNLSRSEFLKMCSGLMLLPLVDPKPALPPLSFSTLGCPDWSLAEIIDFAVAHHYQGVEIRGIQHEQNLPVSKYFNSPSAIRDTKKQFSDKGIRIVGLGSSCELHHADAATRRKNLNEGRRFTALASQLGCPYIRVFPNSLPSGQGRSEVMGLISQGLNELGNEARGSGVKILMETHGGLVQSDDIQKVMGNVESTNTGLVWDVANMWSVTKESPAVVYPKIKKYVMHTHIKDLSIADGKDQYKLLGRGQVPIFEAIDLLIRNKYKGYFSFEWEKLWHPEIEASELALADYPVAMKKHFG